MPAPQQMRMVSSGVHQQFLTQTMQTAIPGQLQISYIAPLHENAKCIPGLGCCGNMCCWSNVKPRSYVMVAENKLETNYPCTPCCLCGGCDCCVYDNIQTVYFDQLNDNWKRVTCCSPYHWFCCCECSGGVAATTKSYAPECCLNCPCCWCCFTYIPGVENADEFVAHMKNAVATFEAKSRVMGSSTVAV